MNDKLTELIKLIDSDIAGLEPAKSEAVSRANYLAGQLDALKRVRDTLMAPDDPPEQDDPEDADEDPTQQPSAPVPLTRKEERKLRAQQRSANGHSKEPIPPPTGAK
jgi:hypothetical protein